MQRKDTDATATTGTIANAPDDPTETGMELPFKRSSRPTICDGEVVTFAPSFSKERGIFGEMDEPHGAFEVSASRNAVVVHRASVSDKESFDALLTALTAAWGEHFRLARRW